MTADDILATARGEIGVRESREGFVKYNLWYYGSEVSGRSYPWCMVFVQWVFSQAGARDLLPIRTASCGTMMRAAKAAGLWVTSDYQPGDIAIYSFTQKQRTDHTGIIERVNGSVVTAIEGNTGTGNDANGGCVMRRERPCRQILGALRPRYVDGVPVSV